jgi:hypothetical protein
MKRFILLSILVISIASCKDVTNNGEGFSFYFKPRKATFVYVDPGKRKIAYYDGGYKYIRYESLSGDEVSINDLFLTVGTLNYDSALLRVEGATDMEMSSFHNSFLDDPIPEVEEQIEEDYRKYLSSFAKPSGLDAMNLIQFEYRTTGIRNLTIKTIDTPLFGKPAGESLNDFFKIVRYDPSVIVSSSTNRLVYGYSEQIYPESIAEWLHLSPLAQSKMYLETKASPGITSPVSVQFEVQLETNEGIMICDTTRVFTITN